MIGSLGAWDRFALFLGIALASLWEVLLGALWLAQKKGERERERKERSEGVVKSISAEITYVGFSWGEVPTSDTTLK